MGQSEIDELADIVVVTLVTEPLVGRTGADGVTLLSVLVEPPRHIIPEPQSWPDWQQPPPKLAGQLCQPELQV